MDTALIQAMCSQRVPKKCPFCDLQGTEWSEFTVHAADVRYFSDGKLDEKIRDEYITVFCTQCNEEIRPEDV